MAIPCSPARVVSITQLSPHMRRIEFEAVGEWRWFLTGIGDERVDIAIPRPGETVAELATFNSPEYGHGWEGEEPPWRHYTMRAVRDGGKRFDIDFVVHEGGVASDWASRAEAGHVIGVFTSSDEPSSYYGPADDTEFQLLVADATGLPGLGRILEQLPSDAHARAIVEVATEADVLPLKTDATVEVTWLIGSGNGVAPSALAKTVAQFQQPSRAWYAWIACEAATSRAIRSDLRARLGLARNRHHAIGYWTQNLSGDRPADVG
ncbi:siderophore-interacting protein [Leucobacter sp. cx-42]|uniref:siderophore-interacting protein n=1 Tax=unclassified Leucobacter TaxID=2621730 RepID=UPI00165D39A4|nr:MULTISPECIES: siderophore-interacting protein [unclassified Leucobacter]MBC9954470.1 siderophore-interacting protein [Leucobacter sp. cx-42]